MGKKKDDNIVYEDGCPDWMLTMGDSMSLLVTFFVLLLSFSTPNRERMLDAFGGIKGALSIMPDNAISPQTHTFEDKIPVGGELRGGGKKEILVEKEKMAVVNLKILRVVNMYNEFKERLMELGFKNVITTKQLEQGISVDVPTDKLFVPGTAQVAPEAPKLLESFANMVNSVGNELQIVDYFIPGENQYSKNTSWNLAQKRLMALADFLNVKYRISNRRISSGYKIMSPGTAEQAPHISMLLAEKIGINETNITQLINESPN